MMGEAVGRESFVTVASSDPDAEQDLTLTSWNLLEADSCVFALETYVEELPLLRRALPRESLCLDILKFDHVIGGFVKLGEHHHNISKQTRTHKMHTVPSLCPLGTKLLCLAVVTSN